MSDESEIRGILARYTPPEHGPDEVPGNKTRTEALLAFIGLQLARIADQLELSSR